MKQFKMTDRKERAADPPKKSSPSDSAFDRWLNRGLHELFDDVMKEPVPPEMLKLLKPDEQDENNKKDDDTGLSKPESKSKKKGDDVNK